MTANVRGFLADLLHAIYESLWKLDFDNLMPHRTCQYATALYHAERVIRSEHDSEMRLFVSKDEARRIIMALQEQQMLLEQYANDRHGLSGEQIANMHSYAEYWKTLRRKLIDQYNEQFPDNWDYRK